MTIQVQYYAIFREQRGVSSEAISTTAQTASELYSHLSAQHGFTLEPELVKLSLNRRFQPMTSILNEGDEVVFIPPVAGG